MSQRFLQMIFAISAVCCISAILLYFINERTGVDGTLVASFNYQGPTQSIPGNPQLVRVEVIVRDSPKSGGLQIQRVDFDGQGVPLQPRDIYGNRGTGSFQVHPGKYKLAWVVQRDKIHWPRLINREELVTIDPRDLWIQIEIIGDDASIR